MAITKLHYNIFYMAVSHYFCQYSMNCAKQKLLFQEQIVANSFQQMWHITKEVYEALVITRIDHSVHQLVFATTETE